MVMPGATPNSIADLVEVIRSTDDLFVVGADGHRDWRCDHVEHGQRLTMLGLNDIISVEPADQVAVVQAGATVRDVQAALAEVGQTLPYMPFEISDDPTVGGALSLGLPHLLEAQCGTWRDWTLGMTVVRPDGTVAKCGSKAVKSVAGYDVARLFVGARGALGVIAEVILRTYPLRAVPAPEVEPIPRIDGPRWIQRTPLSSVGNLNGSLVDPLTATVWTALPIDGFLPRFSGDWVLRSGCGSGNLPQSPHPELTQRAKALFDPTSKLNRGALGDV